MNASRAVHSTILLVVGILATNLAVADDTGPTSTGVANGLGSPSLLVSRSVRLPDALTDEERWHANNEMRLRGDGNIPGQLRSYDSSGNLTPVRARLFFVQKGEVIGRAQSDDKGNFQAIGLKEGIYSVIVASPQGFGAIGVNILPFVGEELGTGPKVKSIAGPRASRVSFPVQGGVLLSVSLVPAEDFSIMVQLISQYIPNIGLAPSRAQAAARLPLLRDRELATALGNGEFMAASARAEFARDRVRARTADLPEILPDEGPWHANHEMRLRADGNIPGQLRSYDAAGNLTPVRARLFFVQKGQVVGRAQSDDKGQFQAIGLKDGIYSVIVASPEGFGAMSIRILPFVGEERPAAPKVKSIGGSGIEQVAYQPMVFTFTLTVVPPGNMLTTFTLAAQNIPQLTAQLTQIFGSLAGVTPAGAAAAAGQAAAAAAAGGGAFGGAAGGAGIAGAVAAGTAGIAAAAAGGNNNDSGSTTGGTTTSTASDAGS